MSNKYRLDDLEIRMRSGEPQLLDCSSPYIFGSVSAERLEKGSNVLGLAKETGDRAIYTGHGRITVSDAQFEGMGRPDRICVDWDGKNLNITPYHVRMLMNTGHEIMTASQLEEMDMRAVSLLSDDYPAAGYSDSTGENFFRKLLWDGEHDLFMRISRGSLGLRKPETPGSE